jgi:hypothetical protein
MPEIDPETVPPEDDLSEDDFYEDDLYEVLRKQFEAWAGHPFKLFRPIDLTFRTSRGRYGPPLWGQV